MNVSIELVDASGRKVRVLVSGHWADLVDDTTARILKDNLGFTLSDIEEWPDVLELQQAVTDAENALTMWETAHSREYRRAEHYGEHAELGRLDAEWNTLYAEVQAARDALEEVGR